MPPQEWTAIQVDQRTFGAQQARTLDDLNRPNLVNIVQNYLQDAMRFWARKPFFFSDTDNTAIPPYANGTIYTQGACISVPNGSQFDVFTALSAGTSRLASAPPFPTAQFTDIPTSGTLPPPTSPLPTGCVFDNSLDATDTIVWANISGNVSQTNLYTQLSTVYNINQYVMPIDLIAFTRVEVTWGSNQRLEMRPLPYSQLRDYDVIRPTPPTTYPTFYAWYQQQLYLWPYPAGQYPITLSYRTSPPVATQAGTSNFWTTQAEALIRATAEARICEQVIGDQAMAQFYQDIADKEYYALVSQGSQQDVRAPIPASEW